MGLMLQFKYNSGSSPGKQRLVYAADHQVLPRHGWFSGIDMEIGGYRRFTVAQCAGLSAVPAAEIKMDMLPKGYRADRVVADYKSEGKLAIHDTNKNVVVVTEKPKAAPTITLNSNSFTVRGQGGYLTAYSNAYRGQLISIANGHVETLTPENLLKYLTKVLNG